MKTLRVKHGLSVGEMARILHITEDPLEIIESGRVLPETDVEILFHIYDAFGVRPNQMFDADFG